MGIRHFNLEIAQDEQELGRIGAQMFTDLARVAFKRRSLFTVVLSGGNTPRPVYETLATKGFKEKLPWDKIHFFWGDERNVPSDDPESNFRMVWVAMLSKLSIPNENIHRIRTELQSPQLAAQDYENTIRDFFNLKNLSDKPRFDLGFLGLGTDGHTASLFLDGFPNGLSSKQDTSVSPGESNRLVIAPWVSHLHDFRISLTRLALNHSDQIIFLVSGTEKASILKKILDDGAEGLSYPAKAIYPNHGKLTWLVDRRAATSLKVGGRK